MRAGGVPGRRPRRPPYRHVTGPEYGEGRDLRLFADVPAAEQFVAGVRARFAACPGTGQDGWAHHNEVRASFLGGDEALTAVQTYSSADAVPTLGATWWEVVRVGHAVLLTVSYGEYDPQHNLYGGIREHATRVAPLVDRMLALERR